MDKVATIRDLPWHIFSSFHLFSWFLLLPCLEKKRGLMYLGRVKVEVCYWCYYELLNDIDRVQGEGGMDTLQST